MRKWNIILWFIGLSLVIGLGAGFFLKAPGKSGAYQIGSVNGSPIYMDEYKQYYAEVKAQIDMIRNYARAQGISEDWFLAMARLSNPQEIAFQEVIENKVLDKMVNKFVKGLDQKYLFDSIAKSLPAQFIGSNGKINEQAYREYLRHVGLTISEFEFKKEEDIKRNLFKSLLKEASYTPIYAIKDQYIQDHSQKSFNVLEISFLSFLEKAKLQKVSDNVLNKFYQDKKENYAVAEKRQAEYWIINPIEYEKKLVINENTINTFYENHKSEMFRTAPEVKVRKIFIGDKVKAEKIYNEVKLNKDKFADFAKKYSEDKSTAVNGGLVNFFKSGTYDKDFEKAAFRLQDKGELSPLVTTKNGFEIILLEDRKAAQYKPLETVKGEVIKALKNKKLDFVIKGDLETLMQSVKGKPEAFDLFAKEKGLRSLKTEFLAAVDGRGNSLESLIAQKMFDKNKEERSKGYFEHNKNFILYREVARKERAILSFDLLKSKLEQDFYNIDAKRKLAEFATKAQADILSGKATMASLQKEFNLKLVNSGLLTKDNASKNPNFASLQAGAFNLSNKNQALIIDKGNDLCIIQLESLIEPKAEDVQREVQKMQNSENDRNKALFVNSFIASLLRNAKIEKNEEMLGNVR